MGERFVFLSSYFERNLNGYVVLISIKLTDYNPGVLERL